MQSRSQKFCFNLLRVTRNFANCNPGHRSSDNTYAKFPSEYVNHFVKQRKDDGRNYWKIFLVDLVIDYFSSPSSVITLQRRLIKLPTLDSLSIGKERFDGQGFG